MGVVSLNLGPGSRGYGVFLLSQPTRSVAVNLGGLGVLGKIARCGQDGGFR